MRFLSDAKVYNVKIQSAARLIFFVATDCWSSSQRLRSSQIITNPLLTKSLACLIRENLDENCWDFNSIGFAGCKKDLSRLRKFLITFARPVSPCCASILMTSALILKLSISLWICQMLQKLVKAKFGKRARASFADSKIMLPFTKHS